MVSYRTAAAVLLTVALAAASLPAPAQSHGRDAWRGAAAAAPAGGAPSPGAEGEPTDGGNAYLPTPGELKLGRDGAAEAEKQYKIVKDGEQVRRLQAIAQEVVRAAGDPDLIREYLICPRARRSGHRLPEGGRHPGGSGN